MFKAWWNFKNSFAANLLPSPSVKRVWKSVNIWWSYWQEFGVLFFWLTVYTYDHYGTLIGSHTLAVTSNKIVCHSDDWKCPKSSSVPAGFGLRYCNAAYCPHSGLARNRLSAEIRRSCRRTVTLIVCNLKKRYRSGKKAVCFKSSLPQVFVTRNNEYT